MGIAEFADIQRAKIERIRVHKQAHKLGKAAVARAQEAGVSETIKRVNAWDGSMHDCVQTPFVLSKGKLDSPVVAVRQFVGSDIFGLVVKVDESNTHTYATVGHGSKIEYGLPEDDVTTADSEVLEAISDIAEEVGVDVDGQEFNIDPVTLADARLLF